MRKEALLRKPIGILLFVFNLLLFPGATIPASAQYTCYNDPRILLGTPDVTPGLPGEQLVRAAVADLYAYNFKPAIPLLEKGVRLGNSDAMAYLSRCYNYGYGVPVDHGKSLQLM
jgi:TPR repeat protein